MISPWYGKVLRWLFCRDLDLLGAVELLTDCFFVCPGYEKW